LTYGFLTGEVIRRVTGKPVGELVAAEIAGPLGLELWVGAPDDVIARTAQLKAGERRRPLTATEAAPAGEPGGMLAEMAKAALDPRSLMNRALGNPGMHLLKGGANHPVILRAGWPAAGVVSTARGLAGFYRALIAGDVLRPETLREAVRVRVSGPDRVLFLDTAFGLGYMRPSLTFLTPSETAFGHSGLGGSIGLGDPDRGLAIAYVMNRMADAISGNLRGIRLVQAVYAAL
jgi:CubicO group peptidase (beta-lactamase class C family)